MYNIDVSNCKNDQSWRGHVTFIVGVRMDQRTTNSSDTAEVKTKEINDNNDNRENSVKDIEKNVSQSVVYWIVVDLAGSEGESACDWKEEITARRLEAWCINDGLIQLEWFFNEMGGIGGKKNIKNNVSGTGFGLRRTLNEYINLNIYNITILW